MAETQAVARVFLKICNEAEEHTPYRSCFRLFSLTMKFLVLDLLGIYKAFVSPFLPPACRFEPTCSEYAGQAVEKYGAIRGTWMGFTRILRCQPLCKGGHDPVK